MDLATRRILHGPLALEIARFGLPLAIGMALQTTFNLVDAYLIAQLPSAEVGPAVGALGICDQIAAIGSILTYGITTASSALLANAKGAGKPQDLARAAWQSMIIVFALSVVFAAVGLGLSGVVVRDVVGAKGEVAVVATRYLRVIVGGSFTIFFLLQFTNMQRALGSAKTPVGILVGGNILNVILAILLVFGPGPAPKHLSWLTGVAASLGIPRMGMLGAAWATLIARAIALVPAAWLLVKRFPEVLPPRGQRVLLPATIREILRLGWPMSAQFVVRISSMLLVNSLVARAFTTQTDQTATTAMGLVFRLDTMALFVAMGWGSAAQTFVGQNLGAGHDVRAAQSGWITAVYDAVTNVVLVVALFAFGENILRIFDGDPAALGIANTYLHIVAPAYLGLGAGVVLGNAMAGAGATKTTLLSDLAVIFGFQFPVSIAVVLVSGRLPSLFQVVAATHGVTALVYAGVYAQRRWLRSSLVSSPASQA